MNKDQTLTLPSGVVIPFRVVRPDDAPALQRLHARCSERTIYLRFFGPMKKLSDEQARYFASTDGVDHFGLVALDPEDPRRDHCCRTLRPQTGGRTSRVRGARRG